MVDKEKDIKSFVNELKKLKTKTNEELTKSELMLIDLQQVIAEKGKYTGQYSIFEVVRKEGEIGERIAEGAHQMMQLRKEVGGKFYNLDEKYGSISKELHQLNQSLLA